MARGHALVGLLGGVGYSALLPAAPLPIRALAVVVTGGAALLPDLDHKNATAAKSLGLLTKLIGAGIDRLAVAVFYATRAPGDPVEKNGGHRLLTHTVPWCLLIGGIAGVLGWVYPVSLVAVCGLLVGLLGLGFRVAGCSLLVIATLVAAVAFTQYPGWSWTVSVAVALGGLLHLVGDWLTPSGIPVLFPLVSAGQRWRMVSAPVTFRAGDAVETALVTPLLAVGLLGAVAWETGLAGVLLEAWWRSRT
jgi:membrane-bound metal-dependent hydrolase YbcI (DUF457 family)